MSEIKQLCPKCYSEVLKVKSVGEIEVTFDIDEEGSVIPSIVRTTKETEADFSQVECSCGHVTTIDKLAQGRQSSVSGKWFPIEQLVAWSDENGQEMIGTQEELDALSAPSLDNMNEEQLREHAKAQVETIASMQEQMAQMMAMMQQLQAAQQAPATQPKEEKPAPAPKEEKPKPTPAPTPAVDTNIPAADESFEVISDGEESDADDFQVVDVTDEGGDSGDDIFGEEAPF